MTTEVTVYEMGADGRLRPVSEENDFAARLTNPERLTWIDTVYSETQTAALLAGLAHKCPVLDGLDHERAARREEDPTKRPPKVKAFDSFVFARMYALATSGVPEDPTSGYRPLLDAKQELVAQEIHVLFGRGFVITIRYPCLAWSIDQLVDQGVKSPYEYAGVAGLTVSAIAAAVEELAHRSGASTSSQTFGLEAAVAVQDLVTDSVFDALEDLRQLVMLLESWVLDRDDWLWDRKRVTLLERKILGLRRLLRQVRWAFMPEDELSEFVVPMLDVEIDRRLRFKLEDLRRESVRALENVRDVTEHVEHVVVQRDTVKSDRLNQTMYVLTVAATVLLVPAVVAGIYGMNFANMPELRWRAGYFGALLLMLVLSLGMLALMTFLLRRKHPKKRA